MKALSRIDGSVHGAILATRSSAVQATISSHPKLVDNRAWGTSAPHFHRSLIGNTRVRRPHCLHTVSWLLSTFLPTPSNRRRPAYEALRSRQRCQQYNQGTDAEDADNPVKAESMVLSGRARRHLLQFIHPHKDIGTVDEHLEMIRDPYLNKYAQSEQTSIVVSERKDDLHYPSYHDAVHGDEDVARAVNELSFALYIRQRYPWRMSLDLLYQVYLNIPQPRMIHLPAILRRKLLSACGKPKKRDSRSMLRYFSLIGEVKNCGLTLRRSEWNYALSLSSRYVGRTTETETEATLHLWKEMEASGMKGNEVTFNILFDAASKSGNFELAELIYKEMNSRGIPFNRYHHVSLIHFFGLKKNSDGVRAAYRETVESGQLVDTAVLNCVISSFLRCDEELSAVRVYRYMKANVLTGGIDLPARNYNKKKIASNVLAMFTKVAKNCPALRPKSQELAFIKPDLRTYRALLNHFCVKSGNFERVVQYLDEMKVFQIPVHGGIFLILFKGFCLHGGEFSSDWSPRRLQRVYAALIEALDNEPRRQLDDDTSELLYLDVWLIVWTLRAFRKCTNYGKVVNVYGELKERWDVEEQRAQFMDAYVNNLLAGKDSTVFPEFRPKPREALM